MESVIASKALFIRLGRGNMWAEECFDKGTIRLDYREINHDLCIAEPPNWDAVTHAAVSCGVGKNTGAVSSHVNQIQMFYEPDEQVLWITFHAKKLYWCRASRDVKQLEENLKERTVIGQWSCSNIHGDTLENRRLSGKLLKVAGFRGTICNIDKKGKAEVRQYLLHKINGTVEPHVARAKNARDDLKNSLKAVIQNLYHSDFEILVDLVFMYGGWKRVGVSGGTEKDIDLDLVSPITDAHIAVQVKSSATVEVWNDYRKIAQNMGDYSQFYFVTHSPTEALHRAATDAVSNDSRYVFWDVEKLADQVVRNGLTGWVLDKAA